MKPLRVLCLDIEGGYGGSSRSLYQSLSHMDIGAVIPEVWCRRDGPVRGRYEAIGISCHVTPEMPHVTSLPRLSRNAYVYADFARRWPGSGKFRDALGAASERFDVVHFNHEGLFLLMKSLRQRLPRKAMTAHIRTLVPDTVFGRWQYRTIATTADRVVFITENERANFAKMSGKTPAGAVIHNAAMPPAQPIAPHPVVPQDGRLKVAVLSNAAFVRGTDRLIEIAQLLALRGRRDVLFVVAGDMTFRDTQPGELGQVLREGGTLADYAARCGVSDMFLFLGHVPVPESVLVACDVLLKPSRDNAPWGREIIEALAMSRPVVSIGHYAKFVETGVTGYLLPQYTPESVADSLVALDADRGLVRRLGAEAAARIAALCDGPGRARDLADLWRGALAASRERVAA